jgi:iron complex transport system substrate-binding protein
MTHVKNGKAIPAMHIAGLMLLIILATGCGDREGTGARHGNYKAIKDCMDRECRIPDRVEKIVDLALLDGIRTLVELGADGRLFGTNNTVKNFMYGDEGRSYACWFAPPRVAPHLKELPSVGECREPNIELIKSLNPDIIFSYASHVGLAGAIEKQTGIPVVCIKSSGCLDFKMFKVIGDITGKTKRADALIFYAKEKIEKITRRNSELPAENRVQVFFWGWPVQDAPRTIAPYDPIDLAGGVNVAMQTKIKPYETYDITKEQLAVWNPDIILLQWWTKKDIGVRVDTILNDPALQTVSAVKNRRVFYSRSFMKGWDPAMGLCEIYYMAKLFYPELYRDMDVEKECNEILKRFYGVDGLYSDFIADSELHRW